MISISGGMYPQHMLDCDYWRKIRFRANNWYGSNDNWCNICTALTQ